MQLATILAVLIFTVGINQAVIKHHEFVAEEIRKQELVELNIISVKEENERSKSTVSWLNKESDYAFHYAGKEKFSNAFSTYRFNKVNGEIVRYEYVYFAKEKNKKGETTYPAYEQTQKLNMETGDQRAITGSTDLIIIKYTLQGIEAKGKDKENKE